MNGEGHVVRTPEGKDLVSLYELLSVIFPPDKPVFERLIREGGSHYTWKPYTLYNGREILGNVSVFSLRIWHQGEELPLAGIASVATPLEHRRKGIARYLMNHVLEILDRERRFAVLFTSLPEAYSRHGFQPVPQYYWQTSADRLAFSVRGGDVSLREQLSDGDLKIADAIYSRRCPAYEGKIVRDPGYWTMYQMLFNLFPKLHIALLRRGREPIGYVRLELEPDRVLISELCLDPSDEDATLALLRFASDYTRMNRRALMTLALPSQHFAWELLRRKEVPLEPEMDSVEVRETFMARPAKGEAVGALGRLQWSLSDKF